MRKVFAALIPALLLLGGVPARAGAPLLRYGLEWGFTPTFLETHNLNYFSSEGYRVDDKGSDFNLTGNGIVLAEVGVNVNERLALSLYAGYAGLSRGNRVFPLLMRVSAFPKGMTNDGVFCFAEAGAGFHSSEPAVSTLPAALLADAGGGYHLALSHSIGLDFQLSLRYTYDHTRIHDPDTGGWIPEYDVRSNGVRYCALCLSIGLNF